jgi:hypothetical protein
VGRHSRPEGTKADGLLVRAHADVRNRCLAALVAPFVLWAAVLTVLDQWGDAVLWLWAPLVVGGVLVGVMLDLGHKRYPKG